MHLAPSALAPIERSVVAVLSHSLPTWQVVSPDECASTHLQAIKLIVRAGMAEARCGCSISSDETREVVTLKLCASGEYEQQEILQAIYRSLPGCWLDEDGRTKLRLNVELQGYSQFRLNEHGVEAQEDLQRGDAQPRASSRILVEAREFTSRTSGATAQATASVGDVVVHNHISIDVGELATRQSGGGVKQKVAERKPPQAGVGSERDKAVRAYLLRRKEDFERLVPLVLMGNEAAERELHATFGPAAIGAKLGCLRQAVSKTQTYKEQIKPLFGRPPRAPLDWSPRKQNPFDGVVASMRKGAGGKPQ